MTAPDKKRRVQVTFQVTNAIFTFAIRTAIGSFRYESRAGENKLVIGITHGEPPQHRSKYARGFLLLLFRETVERFQEIFMPHAVTFLPTA